MDVTPSQLLSLPAALSTTTIQTNVHDTSTYVQSHQVGKFCIKLANLFFFQPGTIDVINIKAEPFSQSENSNVGFGEDTKRPFEYVYPAPGCSYSEWTPLLNRVCTIIIYN
jgi:hypothetical protein